MPVLEPTTADASAAAAALGRLHGGQLLSIGSLGLPASVMPAIVTLLERVAVGEPLFWEVGRFVPDAERPRCAGCGEPIELADASDAESWIHAEDANYFGDHTAWVATRSR